MPAVRKFVEATEFVFFEMRGYESVICSSIMAALDGNFGNFHRTRRTVGSELWINPLMLFYWAFDPEKVAEQVLYMNEIRSTDTLDQVQAIIRQFRRATAIRAAAAFPQSGRR